LFLALCMLALVGPSVNAETALATPDPRTPPAGGALQWRFSQDPANPEFTAQASIEMPVRYGESVTLFIDCQKDFVGAMIGYSGNSVNLPEPNRSMVARYMRGLFVEAPTLLVMRGTYTLGRISWSAGEGGSGKVSATQMLWLLRADKVRLTGGKQVIDFPMNSAPQALAGVIRQCRMKLS
jgi:hypothetical protein